MDRRSFMLTSAATGAATALKELPLPKEIVSGEEPQLLARLQLGKYIRSEPLFVKFLGPIVPESGHQLTARLEWRFESETKFDSLYVYNGDILGRPWRSLARLTPLGHNELFHVHRGDKVIVNYVVKII